MSTVLEFIRTIEFEKYDLNPPENYDPNIPLEIIYTDVDNIRIRNLKSVCGNIKDKIKGYIDYHIAMVSPENLIVIGFNREHIYIYTSKIGNEGVDKRIAICFSLEELNQDDFYLILRYGKILRKEFNI